MAPAHQAPDIILDVLLAGHGQRLVAGAELLPHLAFHGQILPWHLRLPYRVEVALDLHEAVEVAHAVLVPVQLHEDIRQQDRCRALHAALGEAGVLQVRRALHVADVHGGHAGQIPVDRHVALRSGLLEAVQIHVGLVQLLAGIVVPRVRLLDDLPVKVRQLLLDGLLQLGHVAHRALQHFIGLPQHSLDLLFDLGLLRVGLAFHAVAQLARLVEKIPVFLDAVLGQVGELAVCRLDVPVVVFLHVRQPEAADGQATQRVFLLQQHVGLQHHASRGHDLVPVGVSQAPAHHVLHGILRHLAVCLPVRRIVALGDPAEHVVKVALHGELALGALHEHLLDLLAGVVSGVAAQVGEEGIRPHLPHLRGLHGAGQSSLRVGVVHLDIELLGEFPDPFAVLQRRGLVGVLHHVHQRVHHVVDLLEGIRAHVAVGEMAAVEIGLELVQQALYALAVRVRVHGVACDIRIPCLHVAQPVDGLLDVLGLLAVRLLGDRRFLKLPIDPLQPAFLLPQLGGGDDGEHFRHGPHKVCRHIGLLGRPVHHGLRFPLQLPDLRPGVSAFPVLPVPVDQLAPLLVSLALDFPDHFVLALAQLLHPLRVHLLLLAQLLGVLLAQLVADLPLPADLPGALLLHFGDPVLGVHELVGKMGLLQLGLLLGHLGPGEVLPYFVGDRALKDILRQLGDEVDIHVREFTALVVVRVHYLLVDGLVDHFHHVAHGQQITRPAEFLRQILVDGVDAVHAASGLGQVLCEVDPVLEVLLPDLLEAVVAELRRNVRPVLVGNVDVALQPRLDPVGLRRALQIHQAQIVVHAHVGILDDLPGHLQRDVVQVRRVLLPHEALGDLRDPVVQVGRLNRRPLVAG